MTVVKEDLQGLQVTLDSLQQQNLLGVEYIVIDSSQDRNAVSDLVNSRGISNCVVHWVAPEGIYSAMNKGIQVSSGEYIYFANAGDAFASSTVLDYIHEVITQQDPDWLMGLIEIREKSGRTVTSAEWNYSEEQSHFFARGFFAPHQGTFVRTSLVRSLGGFDTSYQIAADYALFLELTRISAPVVIGFPIARFTEGGASTIHWKRSFREFHRARRDILAPAGLESVREYIESMLHFSKVGIVKILRTLKLKS